MTDYNIQADIIILTECWLSKISEPPSINGYSKYYTTTAINQNDGLIVYIKQEISATVKEFVLPHGSFLVIGLGCETNIICSYRPPQYGINPSTYLVSLDTVLKQCNAKHLILAGDINFDTIAENKTSHEEEYLSLIASYGLLEGVNKPTHYDACLDHFMIKSNYSWLTAVFEPLTDHRPILLYINKAKIKSYPSDIAKTTFDYDSMNNLLTEIDWNSLYSLNDVNEAASWLISSLQQIIVSCTLTRVISSKLRPLKPWITVGMVRTIRKRDFMHKQLRATPNNEQLRLKYNNYRNWCNKIVKTLKVQYYQKKLEESKSNSKQTWKVIKDVCNMGKFKESRKELLGLNSNPKDSLDIVNNFFSSIGSALAESTLNRLGVTQSELAQKIREHASPQLNSMLLLPTDEVEVRSIILKLRTESAPGMDNISTVFVKKCMHNLLSPIAFICNLSFETGIFPSPFKKAIITPVFKAGDKSSPTNYRPISLLSTLSKILEKLANKRLMTYLSSHSILAPNQFGFRHGRSTDDAVLNLTERITYYVDDGDKCVGVFLDLQKAFDTVSIPILLTRLEIAGVRGVPLQWFANYLEDREQFVRLEKHQSSSSQSTFGVPQGSTLGPTLFLLYINELCKIDIEEADVLMFADDTAILFKGKTWDETRMIAEKGMAQVSAWLEDNLLSLNVSKTNFICFTKTEASVPELDYAIKLHEFPCNRQTNYQTTCSCKVLARTDHVKYLGVFIDKNLKWDKQIDTVSARTRRLIYVFKNLRTVADPLLLTQVYKALCESILTYCICSWGGAAKTYLIQVERSQRFVLKVMRRLPYRYPTTKLYEISKVLSVRKLFIYQVIRRYHKIEVPNLPVTNRRRDRCPIPMTKSTFAQRFYNYLAPKLYNSLNKKNPVRQYSNHQIKKIIKDWLDSFDYEGTEALLMVIK